MANVRNRRFCGVFTPLLRTRGEFFYGVLVLSPVIQAARQAVSANRHETEIVHSIKRELELTDGPAWSVVVGPPFGGGGRATSRICHVRYDRKPCIRHIQMVSPLWGPGPKVAY